MSNANTQRLRSIEHEQTETKERLARIETKIGDIHCWMRETDARPSLPVRVDRLERFQRGEIRILWAIIASIATAAGAWMTGIFSGK